MTAVASSVASVPRSLEVGIAAASPSRFTLDGDAALEAHLAHVCEQVRWGVERLIPAHRREGILLGGGYGRGEGGVLRTAEGDRPYNDLEFYVLLRGSTVWNDRRYGAALHELAHELGVVAGIEVEFKVLSAVQLRRASGSMFFYDLVWGHRRVAGAADVLRGCTHHRVAAGIPLAEATRLLFNRCSGLLFARARLGQTDFTPADADFVERNLAKARLALGDAVLTTYGEYHWSCRERARRLAALTAPAAGIACLDALREAHARGVNFKLHPVISRRTQQALHDDFTVLASLAERVWLWIESRRLGTVFPSSVHYALHPADKCPETSGLRNWLVNLRRFGGRACGDGRGARYPRERLFRALSVLLWQPEALAQPVVRARLQAELRTKAEDEPGLLAAYTRLWEIFR